MRPRIAVPGWNPLTNDFCSVEIPTDPDETLRHVPRSFLRQGAAYLEAERESQRTERERIEAKRRAASEVYWTGFMHGLFALAAIIALFVLCAHR
jgi:hypothetical protein